jgi:uncharacterized protein YegP (UPF0339 family)
MRPDGFASESDKTGAQNAFDSILKNGPGAEVVDKCDA